MKQYSNYIFLGILGLILMIGGCNSWGSYNSMVSMEEGVTSRWAQVENVYQRRMDMIPNLVNIVSGVAGFEKSTLTEVIQARASATQVKIDPTNLTQESLEKFQSAQNQLGGTLSRLLVSVERYPELKATDTFIELMSQLEGTENRISVERREFNKTVQDYNTYIRRFPRNLWASVFGFEKTAYFEADKAAATAPNIKF